MESVSYEKWKKTVVTEVSKVFPKKTCFELYSLGIEYVNNKELT